MDTLPSGPLQFSPMSVSQSPQPVSLVRDHPDLDRRAHAAISSSSTARRLRSVMEAGMI